MNIQKIKELLGVDGQIFLEMFLVIIAFVLFFWGWIPAAFLTATAIGSVIAISGKSNTSQWIGVGICLLVFVTTTAYCYIAVQNI